MEEKTEAQKIYGMIFNRNRFYHNNFRFLIVILLCGIVSFICLFIASIYMSFSSKQAWYIPVDLNGTVIKKENILTNSTDGVEITDAFVIDWTQKAIPYIYNFNFLSSAVNFRNMIEFFTPDGYKAYKYALESQSKTLDTIKAAKLVVQGYGCGTATSQILSKGVQNVQGYPVYTWRLQMPMVAKYISSSDSSVLKADLTVDVQRVPKLIAEDGIAIYSFIVSNQTFYKGDVETDKLCTYLFKN